MTFTQALAAAWQKNDSLLCVGLDPDPAKFPAHLKGRPDAIFEFCKAIADATADLVCCFKPQIAYFAAQRAEDQLEALIAHIHARHPGIPVILAGITGSASGGMSIALGAMAKPWLEWAAQVNLDPQMLHRIASLACGGLDSLPHNGAVITLLAVCGMTHKESYIDIGMITVVATVAVSFIMIAFHAITGLV